MNKSATAPINVISNATIHSVSWGLYPWTSAGTIPNWKIARKKVQQKQLHAVEISSGDEFTVYWKRPPKGPGYEVFVGSNIYIGIVERDVPGWRSKDRFGTIVEGFASRRTATMHMLIEHYQFTPRLVNI